MSDTNSAKQAARRLFKKVSYQDGPLGSFELSSLLTQTYQILKIPFKATPNDIKIYEQVLDADRDGKVTLKDLEAKAIQYLCSNTLISSISGSSSISNKQTLYKNLETESVLKQTSKAADISSFAQSSYSETSQPSGYSQYSQNNYGYSTQNDQGTYNYNYKSSFQTQNKEGSSQSSQYSQAPLGNYGSDALSSYDQKSNFSKSGYDSNPGQVSERSLQYGYTGNEYNSNSYVNQSYSGQQESYLGQQQQSYSENPAQSYISNDYTETNEQDRPYSQIVRQYIAYVSQVFMHFADPVEYTVTEQDVPNLLTNTYAVLGRENYIPTPEDVQTWMKLCDVNQDGKVQYQQYEYFVVKSLERSGLNLYD